MKDVQERSQSMRAYASSHAEPDSETTARMRERLQQAIDERSQRRHRIRAWVQSAIATAVVLVGLFALARSQGWLGTTADVEHRGVLSTADVGQVIELDDGRLRLSAHTLVRLVEHDRRTEIELVEGEVALLDAPGVVVRIGAYAVEGPSRDVTVRRTPDVPLVTVREGSVVLSGPDLPAAGVTMAPL